MKRLWPYVSRALVRYLALGFLVGLPAFAQCADIFLLEQQYQPSFTSGAHSFNQVETLTNGLVYLLGGFSCVNGSPVVPFVRLAQDGSLDTTFAVDSDYAWGTRIGIQPDGKLIVCGNASRIGRLNADGSIDAGFQRQYFYGFNGYTTVNAVIVLPDGRICIGGDFEGRRFGLERLLPDGSLDPTFVGEAAGEYSRRFGGVSQIGLQSSGKLILGLRWRRNIETSNTNRLIRLHADGSLDTTFSQASLDLHGNVTGLAVQDDDRIVISGTFRTVNGQEYTNLARFFPDGTLDTTFHGNQAANDLVQLPEGGFRVLAAISTGAESGASFVDKHLDQDGRVLSQVWIRSIAPQSDGRPILSADGTLLIPGNYTNESGVIQSDLLSVGIDGSIRGRGNTLIENFGRVYEILPIPGSDQVYVQGTYDRANHIHSRFATRLNSDGSVDRSFDAARGLSGSNSFSVFPVGVDTQGRVLVTESMLLDFGVYCMRLNPDGTQDTTFQRSFLTLGSNIGQSSWIASSFTDKTGRVYVTGVFHELAGRVSHGVARLLPDGTFDPSFVAQIGLRLSYAEPMYYVMGEDDQGKILFRRRPMFYEKLRMDEILVRLEEDGSLDPSFTPVGSLVNHYLDASLAEDGKIIVAGFVTLPGLAEPVNALRLNRDGSLDTTFKPVGGGAALDWVGLRSAPGSWFLIRRMFDQYPLFITQLDSSGTVLAEGVSVPTHGSVDAFSVSATGLVTFGGGFTSFNGELRLGMARFFPHSSFAPPVLRVLRSAHGSILEISGPAGLRHRIEQSSTLGSWQALTNVSIGAVPFQLPLPAETKSFFRVAVP